MITYRMRGWLAKSKDLGNSLWNPLLLVSSPINLLANVNLSSIWSLPVAHFFTNGLECSVGHEVVERGRKHGA